MFPFLNFESKAALSLVTEVNISEQEHCSSLRELLDILKKFYQAEKTTKLRLPKPENDIGYTESQTKVLSHCIKQIIELLNTQMRLSHQFQNFQTCIFPVKNLYYRLINSNLQKIFTFFMAKITIALAFAGENLLAM